jgi:transposase
VEATKNYFKFNNYPVEKLVSYDMQPVSNSSGGCAVMNVKAYSQHQSLMFPPHVRDFLPDDHPAVIINDIIESLDLTTFYQKLSSEGAQAYHPKMMLKILVYAYAHRIFGSRKIQAALSESIAFIFLAAWQKPDFRTISDFRKNNRARFLEIFAQSVDICRRLGMVSLGHLAIDGSKFKANASDKRTYDQKHIDHAIQKLVEQAEQIDAQEDQLFGVENAGDQIPDKIRRQKDRLEKLKQIKKQLQDSGKEKINATDADAVFMKTGSGVRTCYNAQIAVDEKYQVIVAAQVTDQPSDTELLLPMVEKAEKAIGPIEKLSADSGYSSGENLQELTAKGIDAYIPDTNYQGQLRGKQEAPGEQFFAKSCFQRDELQDCFICPAGKRLNFSHFLKTKGKGRSRMYRCRDFKTCPLKSRCTKGRGGRSIIINAYDDQFRAMRNKLDSAYGKRLYARRQSIVEPVFGHIKESLGFRRFLLRGIEKVNGEFAIVCIAHNLRKIINALKPRRLVSKLQGAAGAIG